MLTTKELFLEYKALLFSTAYNMLGSIDDAEDMVQETYLKWLEMTEKEIKHTKAYLVKIVVNKCMNFLESAKVQREQYIGVWLPESLPDQGTVDDHGHAESYNALSIGMLMLMEKLTPQERAIFILREVFAYDYQELSEIFEKSEDNCRQIFRRAKESLGKKGRKFDVDPKVHEKILNNFIKASVQGNIKDLINIFKEEITLFADGGGKTVSINGLKLTAAINPIRGKDDIAKFLSGVNAKISEVSPHRTLRKVSVNGLPSILFVFDGNPLSLLSLDTEGDKITDIYIQTNPDKLKQFVQDSDHE